jgi:hypothetical protein
MLRNRTMRGEPGQAERPTKAACTRGRRHPHLSDAPVSISTNPSKSSPPLSAPVSNSTRTSRHWYTQIGRDFPFCCDRIVSTLAESYAALAGPHRLGRPNLWGPRQKDQRAIGFQEVCGTDGDRKSFWCRGSGARVVRTVLNGQIVWMGRAADGILADHMATGGPATPEEA